MALLLRILTWLDERVQALLDVWADYLDLLLCEMSEECCGG